MKTLIVCVSVSHGNTRKLADAMASVLHADVVEPEDVDVKSLATYDLVGFGSGIYGMAFHPRLTGLVDHLPKARPGARAFVFNTRGGPELPFWSYTRRLTYALESSGYDVAGSFSCLGWDTWLPLRLIGGINRGRPSGRDLEAGRAFARGLIAARPSAAA